MELAEAVIKDGRNRRDHSGGRINRLGAVARHMGTKAPESVSVSNCQAVPAIAVNKGKTRCQRK
jgi:hypothetical protein